MPFPVHHTRIMPVLIAAVLVSLPACSPPSDPMGIELTAADSSFAALLADLHEADVDALLSMEERVFAPDGKMRDSVLHAHGLTEDAFQELAEQHAADPERFVAIYNRALDVASGR